MSALPQQPSPLPTVFTHSTVIIELLLHARPCTPHGKPGCSPCLPSFESHCLCPVTPRVPMEDTVTGSESRVFSSSCSAFRLRKLPPSNIQQ